MNSADKNGNNNGFDGKKETGQSSLRMKYKQEVPAGSGFGRKLDSAGTFLSGKNGNTRILKCFVLINLKIGDLTHQDLEQL